MNVKSFTLLGLDLTDYVTSWGKIEEVKEILLAKSDLFTGQMDLVLDNSKGIFSPNSTPKAPALADYTLAGKSYTRYSPLDLLAQWEFEQTPQDWSGNRRNLETVGTVPYALVDAGRGDYAAGPFTAGNYLRGSSSIKDSMMGDFTVYMDVDLTPTWTAAGWFLYMLDFTPTNGIRFQRFSATQLRAMVDINGSAVSMFVTASTGRHRYAIVRSGSNVIFYADGLSVGSTPGNFSFTKSNAYFGIGAETNASNPVQGYVNAARIYSRALTHTELVTITTPTPTAYYGLTQDGADWMGNGYDLTRVGTIPFGANGAGPFSTANRFTGPSSLYSVGTSARTIFGRVLYPSVTGYQGQTCQLKTSVGVQDRISVFNGTLRAQVYNSSDRFISGSITAGTSTAFALVISGTERTLYINGLPVASDSYGLNNTYNSIDVGSISGETNNSYLKDFRIYTTALTPAEIAAISAETFPPALTVSEITELADDVLDLEVIDTPANAAIFQGRTWFNKVGMVDLDSRNVFTGLLKDIKPDHQTKTVNMTFENYLSQPSETPVVYSATNINPVKAMVKLFDKAGLLDIIDTQSFNSAAGPSQAGGAVINVASDSGSNTTLLELIQQISELASVSVYVSRGLIRCKAWRPYSGGGLIGTLQESTVRTWGSRSTAYEAIFNQAQVKYGAASVYTATDSVSANMYTKKIPKPKAFDTAVSTGTPIQVPDAASAQWFASNYIARAAMLRDEIDVEVGIDQWPNVTIGDKFAVTAPHWALSADPFEVIETHRDLSSTTIELKLASLASL